MTHPRRFTRGSAVVLAALAVSACDASVSDPSSAIAVDVRPPAPQVEIGGSVDFDATVTGTANLAVTWSVREVAGGTVDATGLYTAPSSTGVYHVVAASSADPAVEGVATVTVTSAPQTWTVSGTLSPAASGAGATVTLSGAATMTATADGSGSYSFVGVANGTYTVMPAKTGYAFTPPSRTVTVSGADVAGVAFNASAFTPNLTVDGSRTFQTIDGMGTNVNVESWKNGELIPALDLLADVNGASLLRVIRDPMDWVTNESDIQALHDKDAATLARIYESPRMQDLWSTIGYLNQKGIGGRQIMLNFMGWTPTWMGGSGRYGVASYITAGKEGAFATMIASLVYYGRTVKGLDFTYVSPMNEPDWDAKEGPAVGPGQYATVLAAVSNELTWFGMDDVRLVAPDISQPGNLTSYVNAIRANANADARTDHYAFHSYSGAVNPGTTYAGKNYWMTETAVWCDTCDQNGAPTGGEWPFARDSGMLVLQDIANGFPAVLVWEGYDTFYYHHDSYSTWGLIAYNRTSGVYTPRKRFYVNSQVTRFVRPGMKRSAVSTTLGNVTALAFHDASSGKVAIVGRNSGGSPVTIQGLLSGIPTAVGSLALYETNSGSKNMQRGADVPVAGNAFSATISADTFFSFSN